MKFNYLINNNSIIINYVTPGAAAGDPDVRSSVTVDLTNAGTPEDLMNAALTTAGFSAGAATDAFEAYNITLSQIGSDLNVEISQGVTVNYNKTAADILQFKDRDGNVKNVADVLNQIIQNLNPDGTVNADGTVSDHNKVFGELLTDMDCIIDNLLSNRSDIGVISNRMDSAKSANESANENMTTVLSKTEDIDFAEKIMEYSVMQTVYQASLQVSAKILPVTILDYL